MNLIHFTDVSLVQQNVQKKMQTIDFFHMSSSLASPLPSSSVVIVFTCFVHIRQKEIFVYEII